MSLILRIQLFLLIGFLSTSCNIVRGIIGTKNQAPKQIFAIANDNNQLKSYNSIITDEAVTQTGLLKVHLVRGKYYFELPDSMLNTDILLVNRIAKTGWDLRQSMAGYAGDHIGESVIRFEKGPDRRIFIREISYQTYNTGDSTMAMHQAIIRNNVQAISAVFPVVAINPSASTSVIEVTESIKGDEGLFSFKFVSAKKQLGLTKFLNDRSYINYVKSFPKNVEINTTKTYESGNGVATLELNTSFVALPKNPMKPRFYDPRVGFFNIEQTDFESNPQRVLKKELITRWRLEPRPEDRAAYFRGELVEPQKPIIFYIDPATPVKLIPFMIQGVNDWQKAFEQAGFKNAIMGKRAPTPEQDPSWSLLDARHSAIVYKPSETQTASGPHIYDPRSGEVLESHINWYHNVMERLHSMYFIQTGAVDPEARSMQYSDELMGEMVRYVAAHEVGHTLGLAHNWASSSTVPVEKLRDNEWLRKHGHTPSVMDYARFNYVAQPEDSVDRYGLFPHIGEYDRWAIEWGYKLLPGQKNAEQENQLLRKLTTERLEKNDKLLFGDMAYGGMDPRTQNEDLGDDAIQASTYGIKNLKRIIPQLPAWTHQTNQDYSELERIYNLVLRQLDHYFMHVSNQIGGTYYTPKMVEQPGRVYEQVPVAVQRAAIEFLDKHLFTTPEWLLEPTVINQTPMQPLDIISNLQKQTLERILSAKLLTMFQTEALAGGAGYSILDLLGDLREIIFREIDGSKAIDIYRLTLQRNYVHRLINIINPPPAGGTLTLEQFSKYWGEKLFRESGGISLLKGELRQIRRMLEAAIPSVKDNRTRYYLKDHIDRISEVLSLETKIKNA